MTALPLSKQISPLITLSYPIYPHTRTPRGFAFVRFKDTAQAKAAMAALHEQALGAEGYK